MKLCLLPSLAPQTPQGLQERCRDACPAVWTKGWLCSCFRLHLQLLSSTSWAGAVFLAVQHVFSTTHRKLKLLGVCFIFYGRGWKQCNLFFTLFLSKPLYGSVIDVTELYILNLYNLTNWGIIIHLWNHNHSLCHQPIQHLQKFPLPSYL
jgi:hypothetical protein